MRHFRALVQGFWEIFTILAHYDNAGAQWRIAEVRAGRRKVGRDG